MEPLQNWFTKKRILIGLAGLLGLLFYVGFVNWVYQFSKVSVVRRPAPSRYIQPPPPTPTPTPLPLQGPGKYACDPAGVCNLYSDDTRNAYCTTTFADLQCLGSCGDPAKRCQK